MISDEVWQFVTKELDDIKERDNRVAEMCDKWKMSIDSPLLEPFVDAQISVLKLLAKMADDNYNILVHFVFGENFDRSYEDLRREIEFHQSQNNKIGDA